MTRKKMFPTVLDLYAGAGGMSMGFKSAGFNLIGAVEVDRWAADTYEFNFAVPVLRKRVSELNESEFSSLGNVDVVCGGPPCQGFSISAKGRTLKHDIRNDEVFHFLSAALQLNPKIILIENVAQFEKYKTERGSLLVDEVRSILHAGGYKTSIHQLNAVNFGVPQNRQRFFLVASRLKTLPIFSAYEAKNDNAGAALKGSITVREALSDLPKVLPRTVEEDAILQYAKPAQNDYQRLLRSHQGHFTNHVPMRHTPRLLERFAKIPVGGNGSTVWDSNAPRRRGNSEAVGSRFEQNHRRMNPDLPSPTITAYMYSTCLHPFEDRNITVREAARLQSFPDAFRFTGKRTTLSNKLLERKGLMDEIGLDQLNQVGNAVPPLLAKGLAVQILKVIDCE